MKIRSLLISFVLAMMVLLAGNINSTATPTNISCRTECQNALNLCRSWCGGDPDCEVGCADQYECCYYYCIGAACP